MRAKEYFMNELLGDKIKKLRIQKGLLQKDLANILGTSTSAIGMYEQNRRVPDSNTLVTLASYFGVSVDYLLGKEDSTLISYEKFGFMPVKKRKIPVLGNIACGQPIYMSGDRDSYVMLGADIDVDFCLRAKGDSMIGARIMDGDIVFIKKCDIVNNGGIAVVQIEDEATLKRVYYYPEKGKLVLQAENPKYEPLVYIGEELNQIHILGRAVAFQSDVK